MIFFLLLLLKNLLRFFRLNNLRLKQRVALNAMPQVITFMSIFIPRTKTHPKVPRLTACTHIFVLEPCQNFNFSQSSLTICLVFKWWYFFDGNFRLCHNIICRSRKRRKRKKISWRSNKATRRMKAYHAYIKPSLFPQRFIFTYSTGSIKCMILVNIHTRWGFIVESKLESVGGVSKANLKARFFVCKQWAFGTHLCKLKATNVYNRNRKWISNFKWNTWTERARERDANIHILHKEC